MNTLTTPFIRFVRADGSEATATMPGAMAALTRDDVVAFSALRPHQRHAWHAFLTQLAVLALTRAELSAAPVEEDEWLALLRGLTPDYPDDEPWCLVAPADRPALLQPASPGGDMSWARRVVATPDNLDMLVTSRNHDLKAGSMAAASADDWLFALITLQTMEGFLGAGNYGISRMNGGFASRPALGLAPAGGPGRHFARDVRRLLALRGQLPNVHAYAPGGGLALVWLRPWDGQSSLDPAGLDPLYIEVCRRVRLQMTKAGFAARVGGSKAARIAAAVGGVTGDPWTPIRPDGAGQKALTVDASGFGYRPLVRIMFPVDGTPSPLQELASDDANSELVLVARALVRGQGKTEGYHERRVRLSRTIKRRGAHEPTDPAAQAAQDRVQLAGHMARALRFALFALFQNGPDKVDGKNDAAERKSRSFLARFDQEVDRTFFEALWREVELDDPDDRLAERGAWVRGLLNTAKGLLDEADVSAAKSSVRRLRARVGAQSALHGAARTNKSLRGYLVGAQNAA